ncbi:MAG: glycoside hydrolase family 2 [Bacteroidales bacterium]|nr:glycoside hydrolase family 2 [Bacteroidales bacterium]
MIKKLAIAALAALCLLASCGRNTGDNVSVSVVEQGFNNVPDSVRIACYWYWIGNNISREGVVKDLHAMKQAGISRAFIGNVLDASVPIGDVPFMSDEWWEITHTAMKTAGDLDIEIGMFNCPGWSQSGGPWIDEDRSMRYVAFKNDLLEGNGEQQTVAMPDVPSERIISVYAYPALEGRSQEWTAYSNGKGVVTIDMKLSEPMTVRSLIIIGKPGMEGDAKLIAADGTPVRELYFNRHNTSPQTGWDPAAPQVERVADATGDHFTFTLDTRDSGDLKVILSENLYVEEYAEKSLARTFQDPLPPFDYYMWEAPAESDGPRVASASMVDLTEFVSEDGKSIVWQVPDGKWNVVTAYAHTTTVTNSPAVPEATGLEVDKMNKEHVRYHFDKYLGEILRRIPAEDRKTFDICVEDSYETGSENWTEGMAEIFEETYGYSPLKYFPVLNGFVVDSEEVSERFLWDMRRLISDKVAYDYVGGLRDVCHENGLKAWLENYGHWGFPSEFLLYGGQSDQVSGEFWTDKSDYDREEPKMAASCAHLYGKKQVWAESCTSGDLPFQKTPDYLKHVIDGSFISGVNSTLLHVYIEQPSEVKPGVDAWFGTEFNRHNTWWGFMDLFTDYLKRCNYMLQQGNYVADVAYFIGEDAPKMAGTRNPELPDGYSYDWINAEILKNHAHVKNGSLVIDSGMSYRVLVLPPQNTMRPEMLECIASLVKDGLTVLGPKPEKSPSLENWPEADQQVCALADEMWSATSYGKGRVYPEGTSLETVFTELGMQPDCLLAADGRTVNFTHRTLADAEVYFVSNKEFEPVHVEACFKDYGYSGAEIWDPTTGYINGVACTRESGRQNLSFDLEKGGSTFIILRNGAKPAAELQCAESVAVDGPWNVEFDEMAGNAAFNRTFPELCDWSESADEDVRYFSGTAHYSSSFNVAAGDAQKYVLHLGTVMVAAKVRINGEYAGGVWTAPFSLDITPFVHEGENSIEVDVANNWVNRLMGDMRLPESQRGTHTNVYPGSDTELQASGLIGPVTIDKLN